MIVARARDAEHARHLYELGVTDAVPETIEASLQLSEAALVGLGVPTGPVIASIHEKRDEFREMLQGAVEEGAHEPWREGEGVLAQEGLTISASLSSPTPPAGAGGSSRAFRSGSRRTCRPPRVAVEAAKLVPGEMRKPEDEIDEARIEHEAFDDVPQRLSHVPAPPLAVAAGAGTLGTCAPWGSANRKLLSRSNDFWMLT